MEFFEGVESVRLRGNTGKYLWADCNRTSVRQKKGREDYGVIWGVEIIPERNSIRFRSEYGLYLAASEKVFLLGATGKKVIQSSASSADSSIEWEPVAEKDSVKLKSGGEKFLRANGGVYPYKNSVTHDIPGLPGQYHVVQWKVEVVSGLESPSLPVSGAPSPQLAPRVRPDWTPLRPRTAYDSSERQKSPWVSSTPRHEGRRSDTSEDYFDDKNDYNSSASEDSRPARSPQRHVRSPQPASSLDRTPLFEPSLPRTELPRIRTHHVEDREGGNRASPSTPGSRPLSHTRRIIWIVAEDDGKALAHAEDSFGGILFKGHSLQELAEQLQIETAIDEDIVLCSRNAYSQELHKMHLELPPSHAPLSVYIVRANSTFGRTLSPY